MEQFASRGGMLPEQVWDEPGRPKAGMRLGRPTGSAMPLMWAHAEYIKLLRSATDGEVFDRIPAVADRYLAGLGRVDLEVWKPGRRVRQVPAGCTLRVQSPGEFILHWSADGWRSVADTASADSGIGVGYVDIPVPLGSRRSVRFTFYWPREERWEGQDYEVSISAAAEDAVRHRRRSELAEAEPAGVG